MWKCWYCVLLKRRRFRGRAEENQWFSGAEQHAPGDHHPAQRPGQSPEAAGGGLCPGELQLRGSAQLLCRPERPLHGAHHCQPGVGVRGRVRGQGDHRHLGGEAGRLPAAAGRLPPGPGGQDPCEVLLPVCPERQRVPGGCPGTEGPGGGGVLRGAGHRHL